MKMAKNMLIASISALTMLSIGWIINTVHAATPEVFIVEVVPSSFSINEAVDITIKAANTNGDIIKDYEGDVFIEINGIVDTADYTLPSDGFYTFLPEDQGVKLFSKGLTIKKPWTFTIEVSDITDDTIKGSKTVIVGSANETKTTDAVSILSPIAGSTEKNNMANIMASAPTLPNAPYTIYVNNTAITEWTTNENGDISAYVSGITQWDNILQIKILNANNEIIGESDITSFSYEPIKDGIFKSITIKPSWLINQWEKVNITVYCSDSVTSTKLKLSNGKSVPMDKKSAGIFTKDMSIDTQGMIDVDVDIIVMGQTKTYTGVAVLMVKESTSIGKIRLYADSIDKSKLNVTRETLGSAAEYRIDYGTEEDNLSQSTTVDTKEIIIENLTIGDTYYFQITPLNEQWEEIGEPSEVTSTKIGEDISCIVLGINVTGTKIGDKYYLVRSAVNNIEKYVIYRADFETNDTEKMQKVGETTGTMFEYPFNAASKKKEYAYYVVEWICKDGTSIKIDSAKKIQVGPAENIMLIILISLFGYTIYKLYEYSKH